MKTPEIIYRLALNSIKGIGPVRSKKIIDTLQDTSLIFSSGRKFLKHEIGLHEGLLDEILQYQDFSPWERELAVLEQQQIHLLFHDQPGYPELLKQCADAPPVLYLKGNPSALQQRCLSIIGTRHHTDYGRALCEELIAGLASYPITIISGLAFGVDGIAHRSALKQQLPTYGVLAHGLRDLYPPAHAPLSKEMQLTGGLLTEYSYFTRASRDYFPVRNRIVAGMSSATIIVETDIRGGSMITAELAYSYNRDVFCFPGRVQDKKSAGCNQLIKKLKAQLIHSADDVLESLGWKETSRKPVQRHLFVTLQEEEQKVVNQLTLQNDLHYDELSLRSGFHTSALSTILLQLELQGIVMMKPGKIISLI